MLNASCKSILSILSAGNAASEGLKKSASSLFVLNSCQGIYQFFFSHYSQVYIFYMQHMTDFFFLQLKVKQYFMLTMSLVPGIQRVKVKKINFITMHVSEKDATTHTNRILTKSWRNTLIIKRNTIMT
jgi:hypothetical protein